MNEKIDVDLKRDELEICFYVFLNRFFFQFSFVANNWSSGKNISNNNTFN